MNGNEDKWKNSVLQLVVTRAIYKPDRPYADPNDETVSGSAFIIDIERGYVVTTSHVVFNAIVITGKLAKLGKRDISLELIGICKEKDLALCKIHHDDIKMITRGMKAEDIPNLNMKFGDNMELRETDEVMSIGYALGNINCNRGIVAGFVSSTNINNSNNNNNNNNNEEDAKTRSPTYILTNLITNPGHSGGPLLNKNGEVVGIITTNSYAIPSRTFLSIYSELIKETIVKMPTLGLEWNKTNREIMGIITGDERTYGIYVRKVHPDSCIDSLEEGDVIKRLEYMDSFWASKNSFNINSHDPEKISKIKILCYFDRYGDASIGTKGSDGRFCKIIDRKLSFPEIMDMIPIGTKFSVEICRNQEWYLVECTHSYIDSTRVSEPHPCINPIDYEIFAGLCCSNLNMSHMNSFENLTMHTKSNRYERRVVICQVFPDTSAFKTQVLHQGQIIESLNGEKVETLNDIRKILRQRPNTIKIKTKDKSYFIVTTETVIPEDKRAMKNFNINHHNYLLDSQ